MLSTVTALLQPSPAGDQACSAAAAPVLVDLGAAEVVCVPVEEEDGEAEGELSPALPTRADSLGSSTKKALTVPFLHAEGGSALPLTKLTATH